METTFFILKRKLKISTIVPVHTYRPWS